MSTKPDLVRTLLRCAMATLLTAAGCGRGCEERAVGVLGVVPNEAVASLIVPPAQNLDAPMRAFLGGLGDTQGVYDFIQGRYGIDVSSLQGVARSGLDPAQPVALWWHEGAQGLVVGALDAGELEAAMVPRLRGVGFGVPEAAMQGEQRLTVALAEDTAAALAWGSAKGAWVACRAAAKEDALRCAAAALGRDPQGPGLRGAPRYQQAFAPLPASDLAVELWLDLAAGAKEALTGTDLGAALGPLTSALEAGDTFAARLVPEADRLALGAWLAPKAGGLSWAEPYLAPPTSPPKFAAWLPRDAAAFVRLRIDPAPLRGLGGLVVRSALPEGALGRLHPLLRDVKPGPFLDAFDGDVAICLFGIAEGATIDRIASSRHLAEALPHLEGAVLLRARDGQALWDKLAPAVAAQAEARGYILEAVPGLAGGPDGARTTHPKGGDTLTALLLPEEGKMATLALVVGAQAAADLRAVVEGRATALEKRAESEMLRAVVLGQPLAMGAYVSFFRLGRELAERGAPPFFLRLLDSIFELGASVRFEGGGLRLDAEVVQ